MSCKAFVREDMLHYRMSSKVFIRENMSECRVKHSLRKTFYISESLVKPFFEDVSH